MHVEPKRSIDLETVRRLAVTKQRLNRVPVSAGKAQVLETFQALGCVQIDPIRVVAPSPELVLWSRLGVYDPADLDELLWQDRELFEYWAHAASIVLMDNFPIHRHQMAAFGTGDSAYSRKAQRWLEENKSTREEILKELADGPARSSLELETEADQLWHSTGWTNSQGVNHLLQLMWRKGEVAVGGRDGLRKHWTSGGRWYGSRLKADGISLEEAVDRSVRIAVQALGVATARHIENHFVRGFYPELEDSLRRHVTEGRLLPVEVAGTQAAEVWFVDPGDVDLIDRIQSGEWHGRTTLLSPFDNLTCDRDRSELLWNYDARSELYVPKKDRVYGHYVIPILFHDRLAGRID
ncbi:MAG: DNA glycosylase AlkZ-like family protein, partial [Anaerolineales bacterium]